MNALGMFLLGAAIRGAGLVAIAGVVGWAFRRKGPAASAWLGLATLVGMVGVAALGASPWPRWEIVGWGEAGLAVSRSAAAPVRPVAVGNAEAPTEGPGITVARDVKPPDEGLAGAVRALGVALMRPAAPERVGWGWPGWIAAAAIVGIAIGLGRFALGLAAVGALRSRSQPIDDPDLLELASVLRQRLGVGPRVELRVAPGLAMPATIGWRRPLILLPEDWPAWDERERRVVLSHELAHIRRNDYLAGVWAQLSLALQFYHPLAHRLALRLRLDQELAADAWGAALSGGNRTYLATLARLALRNEPRPVGWAARSFSPARGTFLRRIEMLRDAHDVSPAPLSRRSRAIALGGLLLAGLALAGLRGPRNEVSAAGPAQGDAASE
ncbi:MAG TPA: M56 family metallopeptidase [Isosphaeraceae bacterium]